MIIYKNDFKVLSNQSGEGVYNILFDQTIDIATAEVYSLFGQKMFETVITNTDEYQLILDKLPKAIYILKISNGNETITKQIVK